MTDLAGGCLCATIRYRVTAPSLCVSHCHCTFCRRAAGAAFITWMTLKTDDLVFTDAKSPNSNPRPGRGADSAPAAAHL